jgi:uncharacterized membrane protein
MKKMYVILILLLFTILPYKVDALREGITNYYIEATVLENGDLHVKELFILNGNFNGFERTIDFYNPNAPTFDGSVSSFGGSDIYNGDGIILKSIKNIAVNSDVTFNYLYNDGDEFTNVSYASPGEYGKYTVEENSTGVAYRIYNPSNGSEKGFYVEYILKNMGILHDDVAEIGWNIFSNQLNEYVNNLEMIVNIPNNQNELRAWGHGPLNGNTDLINKDKIKLTITDLNANTAMDIRFVFDKSVISESSKITNVSALDKILQVETKWADEANEIREKARKQIEKEKMIGKFFDVINVLWILGLIVVVVRVYNKYDKEYSSTFKTRYFRDFPATYGPEIVGYLFKKRISNNDLSASILNLIARKVITFEEGKGKDYVLKLNEKVNSNEKLSLAEVRLTKWLFEEIGSNGIVSMKAIQKDAKSNYESFLGSYNIWKELATDEAIKEDFYENHGSVKGLGSLYSISGSILAFIAMGYPSSGILIALVIIAAVVSFVYFVTLTKRTKKGNEDFTRWNGLKNFLKDFGKFESRDLPQIHLWEKYLVYAVTFGCANKLAKTMQIKFNELSKGNYTATDAMFDIYYINMLTGFNRTLNSSVNSAVTTALSTKAVAESRSSSSGGFGGGFSGGGGSFGGGGGGGRF